MLACSALALLTLGTDPLAQEAYLKASNTFSADFFGRSVAISGDTLVVGAPGEDSSAGGVNGDESDDSVPGSGAVYVFVRSGGVWSQQAYLKASNPELGDEFGGSVSISGDTLAVGAIGEDSAATGVNGDEGDDGASASGAVYVFTRSGTTWSQQAYLKASNTGELDNFGFSVSVSGDTLLVGAPYEDSPATGVNGNGDLDTGAQSGAAYVFVRGGSTWSQQAYLKASNTGIGDRFGWATGLSGDTAIVGAIYEDSSATGVDGNGGDDGANNSGAAYVFARNSGSWSQQGYLKASNTGIGDSFGWSVAVDGDTAVVGATNEDSGATGVNGNEGDDGTPSSGAAYVYTRGGSTWSQQAYLKASNSGFADLFGYAAAVAGDAIVVGARQENGGASGLECGPGPDTSASAGAAYAFGRVGTVWSEERYLKASRSSAGDLFGQAVALSGDTIAVGAPGEGSSATGVDGDHADDAMPGAGAANVFVPTPPPVGVGTGRCFCGGASAPCGNADPMAGCVNSTGVGALLVATGSASVAAQGSDPLVLHATRATPHKASVWIQGATQQQTSFNDGNLCVGSPSIRLPGFGCHPYPIATLDACGAVSTDDLAYGFDVVAAALCKGDDIAAAAPTTRDYQLWYRDGMGPCGSGSNLTNAVQIDWLP